MTDSIIGWDVGGANIKAARVDAGHSSPTMVERALPLWRELDRLPSVLGEVATVLGPARTMAVTMTAELADCFADKPEGVAGVLDAFLCAFPDVVPWVYGTDGDFRLADEARRQPYRVAAANWLAGATLVSHSYPDAIFIDVGSTTTDIIPIVGGRVVCRGRTDSTRLTSGELVYTGVLRTPVASIVRTVPFRGRRCRVSSEYFATSADVYRWLGRIDDQDYTCETPDRRGRSRQEAGARLARMICADFDTVGPTGVSAIAAHVATKQLRQIVSGVRQVVRRMGPECPGLAVVAGQGSFLAAEAASAVGMSVVNLASRLGLDAARAIPAAAVAYLLEAYLATHDSHATGVAGGKTLVPRR
jgi:probable H4MPT-linked C1 transfer pathway protein